MLRKGVWIFGFPNQKSKKNQGKRWIFLKKEKNPRKKMDFSQKSEKMKVNIGFLQESIFLIFLDF